MGSVVSCFGLTFGVRTNAAEVWPDVVDRLPFGSRPVADLTALRLYSIWAGAPPPRRGVRPLSLLYRNGTRLARSAELGDVLSRFESDLRTFAARWSTSTTFLRATGVRIGDRAVLVAGLDSRREDPLVQELVRRGGRRFARDVAPLDREGRLAPCMAFRALDRPRQGHPIPSIPIGLVVLSGRTEGGGSRLEPLGRAFATVELMARATTVAVAAGAQLRSIETLARRAVVARLTYADPAAAAGEVLDLLSTLGRGARGEELSGLPDPSARQAPRTQEPK